MAMMTTLCAVAAALRVLPNTSQFFQYESVSLSCEGMSSEWRVKRNTSAHVKEDCLKPWERVNESQCVIDDLYPSDTGAYWCESAAGECRDAVHITVTAGAVILQSPVLPVTEGDAVTLSCRNKTSSSLTADFYKDGRLIRSSSTGEMIIKSVSRSDEGLYSCSISGDGESPQSRLTVRAGRPAPPRPPLAHVLLPVVAIALVLVSLVLLCLWRRLKGKVDPDVAYTDVTITQAMHRIRDVDAAGTFYSTVKTGNT